MDHSGDEAAEPESSTPSTPRLPGPGANPPPPPRPKPAPPPPPAPGPRLPTQQAPGVPAMADHRAEATTPSQSLYRSDRDRQRSLYRMANPWHRRVLRGVVALSVVAAVGLGLFIGIKAIDDYVGREKLPPIGADVPDFRSTTYLIASSAPGVELAGTLTLDLETKAFEFIGSPEGPQRLREARSPDGLSFSTRAAQGTWQPATADDPTIASVLRAIVFLIDVDSVDDLLESQMRRGYVDLVDTAELGSGTDARDVYTLDIDTASYAMDYPLQWQVLNDQLAPGMPETDASSFTITIDDDNVLVALDVAASQWAWERLSYSAAPFEPAPPDTDTVSG